MIPLEGVTAEEFIGRQKVGTASTDYRRSKYDVFRDAVAQKLGVLPYNVDVFTIVNHPTLMRTVDLRYSVRSNLYHRPAKLDGLILASKPEASSTELISNLLFFDMSSAYNIFTGSSGHVKNSLTT